MHANDFEPGRDLLLTAPPVSGEHRLDTGAVTGKPVIVTFFASWCPPCTEEFAALNEIRRRYRPEQLGIVAVNAFEDWGGRKDWVRMGRFLDRTEPQFPMVEASPEILAAFGGVTRIPTLIVYDRNGREVWRFVHKVNATKMSADVEDIVSVLAGLGLN